MNTSVRTAMWISFDAAASAGKSAQPGQAKIRRRLRRSTLVVGVIVGMFVTLLVAGLVWMVVSRDPTPLLTEADFQAAQERWRKHGPASYDMDVLLAGNRPGPVHVEVREGQVTLMTRDGVVPRQQRTWEFWTVQGMFATIEQELAMAESGPRGSPDPAGTKRELRASFDAELGFPRRFQRTVLGGNQEVDWTVTGFTAIK